MQKKTLIAVTGKTGSGKTLCCQYLTKKHPQIIYINCDKIGHTVLQEKTVQYQLCQHFGNDIILNHNIIRSRLRKKVFKNIASLKKLNKIMFPLMIQKIQHILSNTQQDIILIDGAIVLELINTHIDHIIYIRSTNKTILDRVPHNHDLLNLQVEPRFNNAYIIDNNGSKHNFYTLIERWLDQIDLNL